MQLLDKSSSDFLYQQVIDYVEKQDVDDSLFEEDKELQLLERISQLSKSFLKKTSEKD